MKTRFIKNTAILLMMLILLLSVIPVSAASGFTDVKESDWFYQSVSTVAGQGIINGYTDGTFRPNNTVTYGEFLSMAMKATGDEIEDTRQPGDHWSVSFYNHGIEKGFYNASQISKSDLTKPIDRGYMAVVISGILGDDLKLSEAETKALKKNLKDVSGALEQDIIRTYAAGIISGYTDQTFRPNNTLLRSHAASVIWKLVDVTQRSIPEITKEKELSSFSIHFIDVGQGDAALIECNGEYMLIDGGEASESSKIYSVLKQRGVTNLKLLVASHGHSDHVGGLSGALNYTKAETILCSVKAYDSSTFQSFEKYANQSGGIRIPKVGDVYSLGSAEVEILGVNSERNDHNDTSIVLKITCGETTFLFTGDINRPAEQVILESGKNLSATVLKVPHHGSEYATTYPFLREVMPQYAVISAGAGNPYGHPTEATLSRLRDAGATVYRTDLQGDIYCISDGKTVTFTVEKNPGADVSSGTIVPSGSGGSDAMSYILNINTMKFHYPSCSSVDSMSAKNKREYEGTREELISSGYDPCGRCHP